MDSDIGERDQARRRGSAGKLGYTRAGVYGLPYVGYYLMLAAGLTMLGLLGTDSLRLSG